MPLEWLASWRLESRQVGFGDLLDTDDEVNTHQLNPVSIRSVKKTGTYKYSVDIEADGRGLLTLSQGYEKGWTAWLGGEKLEHVKVNSWANGWMIEESECSGNDICKVIIVYWPQYLEYIGFGLIFFVLIYLCRLKKVDKSHN